VRKEIRSSKEDISDLREDLESLENEFYVNKNNREYDFGKKMDERDYKEEKEDLENEISKLKASVSALAEEMDSEDKVRLE
jgi:polyhydroxyalkanoate synthesis regulator phasin